MTDATTTDAGQAQAPAPTQSTEPADQQALPLEQGEPNPPPAETPKEPEPPVKPDRIAKRVAKISAKEQAFAAKKAEIDAQIAKAQEYDEVKGLFKKDPATALAKIGVSFDELTQLIVDSADPANVVLKQTKEEIDKLRKELADKEAASKEENESRERARYEKALTDYKSAVESFLDKSGDKYEIAKLTGASELVANVVVEHYNVHGELLEMDAACAKVEEYLEGQLKRFKDSKKLRGWLGSEAAPVEEKEDSATLTNSDTRTVASGTTKPMTRDERRARALAKLLSS